MKFVICIFALFSAAAFAKHSGGYHMKMNQSYLDAMLRSSRGGVDIACEGGTISIRGKIAYMNNQPYNWVANPGSESARTGQFLLNMSPTKNNTEQGLTFWRLNPICSWPAYVELLPRFRAQAR